MASRLTRGHRTWRERCRRSRGCCQSSSPRVRPSRQPDLRRRPEPGSWGRRGAWPCRRWLRCRWQIFSSKAFFFADQVCSMPRIEMKPNEFEVFDKAGCVHRAARWAVGAVSRIGADVADDRPSDWSGSLTWILLMGSTSADSLASTRWHVWVRSSRSCAGALSTPIRDLKRAGGQILHLLPC